METLKEDSHERKLKSRVSKEEWREYTKTVWEIPNESKSEHPAVFPPEIPHRLIKLFSLYGDTVLDPFAGTGTTASAALSLGRNVICVEQNPSYVQMIKQLFLPNENQPRLDVVLGDSRDLGFVDDDSIGLVVTSPPYWNKADYGAKAENLGNIDNYTKFLKQVKEVFEECHRVLIPNRKICVVTANVNQYTDYGLLTFPLAADFIHMLRDIGFVMITEIIWSKYGTGGKWGSWGNQRPIFGSYPYPPNFLFKNVNEFIIVFAKGKKRKKIGKKALPLEEII